MDGDMDMSWDTMNKLRVRQYNDHVAEIAKLKDLLEQASKYIHHRSSFAGRLSREIKEVLED